MIITLEEFKRFIEGTPNIRNGFLLKDPLELFKEDFPDEDPLKSYSLATSKGHFSVISYYGNEIGFIIKLKQLKQSELTIIITQENTLWVEEILDNYLHEKDISKKAIELTFENLLNKNYGISLNFNKFNCRKGHEDVALIKKYFSSIVDFIRDSSILKELTREAISFDANNSGQIILQQILGHSITTRGGIYELLLHDTTHLKSALENRSVLNIFLDRLGRFGFTPESILRQLIEENISLAKKEIELIIYNSIYGYLSHFKDSPICRNLSRTKIFLNLPRYREVFEYMGLKEEVENAELFIQSEELFHFRGIDTYFQFIEFKEFIEPDEIPDVTSFKDAIGVFHFEWDQLVRESTLLPDIRFLIKSTFQPVMFRPNLQILDSWSALNEFTQEELEQRIPDWQSLYEYLIPFEKQYQFLRSVDIQHRVLVSNNKVHVLHKYEAILKDIHERYYPYLLEQYENPDKLVYSAIEKLKSNTKKSSVLMVFDGMRYDFWTILREQIIKSRLPVEIEDDVRFAIAPTLTEISRNAIFAKETVYGISEEKEFQKHGGTFIKSELAFYEEFNPKNKLTGVVLRFIDNRIHISSSLKGEFVEFSGIQEDFRRYVDSVIIPMLRHIFSSRTTQVLITSDHGFVNIEKENSIYDSVFDESFKAMITRLDQNKDLEHYRDMFLISPNEKTTKQIRDRYQNDVIIIGSDRYEQLHIPTELGGDAIVFPKIYRHLGNGSLRFNHGSLSIFETMLPFATLTYKYE